MCLDITVPSRQYICVCTDFPNKEEYASIDGDFRLGETYNVEGSMSGTYWYIFDKAGNYMAVVKRSIIDKNFVSAKQKAQKVVDKVSHHSHSMSFGFGKYVCIRDCETTPSMNAFYTLLPRKFVRGRTYGIKNNAVAPSVRYIYEDGLNLETFIASVDKSFVDANFVSRDNKEYNIFLEIDGLFDKYFDNE